MSNSGSVKVRTQVLRARMQELGLTVELLAEAADLTPNTVQNVTENGTASAGTVLVLCRVMGLRPTEVMVNEEEAEELEKPWLFWPVEDFLAWLARQPHYVHLDGEWEDWRRQPLNREAPVWDNVPRIPAKIRRKMEAGKPNGTARPEPVGPTEAPSDNEPESGLWTAFVLRGADSAKRAKKMAQSLRRIGIRAVLRSADNVAQVWVSEENLAVAERKAPGYRALKTNVVTDKVPGPSEILLTDAPPDAIVEA